MTIAQIIALVADAYARLGCLNNICLTAYRAECTLLAIEEETRHRKGFKSRSYPKHADIKHTAQFFVVLRIAESLLGKRLTIKDLIHTQPSAVYASSLVDNYQDEIRKAWADLDLRQLVALDYCEWITDWKANESGASDGYQPGPGGCKNTINWGEQS